MELEKKPGIPERFFIACFRPSRYKELLTTKTAGHVIYACCIISLLVMIEAVIPFAAWDLSVGGLNNLITERFPAFTVEKGEMNIASPVEFDINGIIHFKADSAADRYEKTDFDEKYEEEVLISKKNVILKMGGRQMDLAMSEVVQDKLDNQSMTEVIPLFRMFLGVYFISTWLVRGIEYMVGAVFFALICRAAIRAPDGRFVNLKGTVVIAVYAKTLFSLLNSVNLCAGNPIGETIMLIAGTFGTILFIDRAEAAVLGIPWRKRRG